VAYYGVHLRRYISWRHIAELSGTLFAIRFRCRRHVLQDNYCYVFLGAEVHASSSLRIFHREATALVSYLLQFVFLGIDLPRMMKLISGEENVIELAMTWALTMEGQRSNLVGEATRAVIM
jgi:hypothetical protein